MATYTWYVILLVHISLTLAQVQNPYPTEAFNTTGPVVSGGGSTGTAVSGGGSGTVTSGGTGPFIPPGALSHHPSVIYFIGSGYDILKGNPDGEYWDKAGDDPGLLSTRKIFYVTKVIAGDPPELEIEHRDSCKTSHEYNLIYSEKSYQNRLYEAVTTSGDADLALKDYAFTLSSGYKAIQTQVNKHHYVFQDYTTLCNMGHARYRLNLAISDHFSVSREFAASVCRLPTTYNEAIYMKFIDDWGTHVITELEIGKKTTYRYQAKLSDYINFVLANASSDVSVGGPMDGFKTSYLVDMDSFKYRKEYRYQAGQYHESILAGDMYWNDEVEMVMMTLDSALKLEFWSGIPMFVQQGVCPPKTVASLGSWRTNILTALKTYPTYKGVTAPTEVELAMPITWPRGTYALPKPKSGCPGQFTWSTGERHQMTKAESPQNHWYHHNHFDAVLHKEALTMRFCVKEIPSASNYDLLWPSGDYCIYQYGGQCPPYFTQGYIQFDDENTNNTNSQKGVLPDGIYNSDTRYNYCCRSDSSYLTPIILPTDKSFYLFKNKHGCQRVNNMLVQEETITWDNDNSMGQSLASLGPAHPAAFIQSNQHNMTFTTVTFCHYNSISSSGPDVIG